MGEDGVHCGDCAVFRAVGLHSFLGEGDAVWADVIVVVFNGVLGDLLHSLVKSISTRLCDVSLVLACLDVGSSWEAEGGSEKCLFIPIP